MVFLVLLWAFIPGELVMKSGKLLSYKGQYTIEGDQVSLISTGGAQLKIPVSAVDLEKTKARDARLDKVKTPVSYSGHRNRELREFAATQPARTVVITGPGTQPDPEPKVEDEEEVDWVEVDETDLPSTEPEIE